MDNGTIEFLLIRAVAALEAIAFPEPPPQVEKETLPEGFPGKEMLEEQGIIYLEQVPRKSAGLSRLGLSDPVIGQILLYFIRERS